MWGCSHPITTQKLQVCAASFPFYCRTAGRGERHHTHGTALEHLYFSPRVCGTGSVRGVCTSSVAGWMGFRTVPALRGQRLVGLQGCAGSGSGAAPSCWAEG